MAELVDAPVLGTVFCGFKSHHHLFLTGMVFFVLLVLIFFFKIFNFRKFYFYFYFFYNFSYFFFDQKRVNFSSASTLSARSSFIFLSTGFYPSHKVDHIYFLTASLLVFIFIQFSFCVPVQSIYSCNRFSFFYNFFNTKFTIF